MTRDPPNPGHDEPRSPGLVAILTDFGTADGYAGALKGALLSHGPGLVVVDVSHEIAPGDVEAAAYVLEQSAPHFPEATVHLVVVDPGVGTARRPLAASIGSQLYVAPDNGVLTRRLEAGAVGAAHVIANPELLRADASPVFHGRDIFAPAAAHLASGGRLGDLGPAIDVETLVRLAGPATRVGDVWTGRVVHVDRFGNLITDIPVEGEARGVAEIGGRRIAAVRTYGDVAPGQALALCGSSGRLEIACNAESAARALGAARGDVVVFRVL